MTNAGFWPLGNGRRAARPPISGARTGLERLCQRLLVDLELRVKALQEHVRVQRRRPDQLGTPAAPLVLRDQEFVAVAVAGPNRKCARDPPLIGRGILVSAFDIDTPMASSRPPRGSGAPTNRQVQELLVRHRCPTPLHQLRTLLLGNIASPRLDVSPMAPLAQAWGGALPEFGSAEDVQELVTVLVQGLWNQLSEHQSARNPFRLPRFEVQPSRQALRDLALTRAQELKGFVDGLFGDEDEMLLPQKAHEAMMALADLYAMFDGAAALLADPTKPAAAPELNALLRNLQQMTIVADENINKALQSCKRARGQRLESMATSMSRRFGDERSRSTENQEGFGAGGVEPEIIESPLSRQVTRNGVTVKVEIYADNGKWILEIVDVENASHVWEEHFETDQLALAEALRALEEEPLEFFGCSADRPLN